MNVAALICARGGSKRIPRKNVQMCAGKKLIEWVLLAARKAECVDEVFVSTDDDEIAAIGRNYQATILRRPWQFATDMAANGSTILHTWSELQKIYKADYVVMLYPTSPLVEGKHIDEAFQLLLSKGAAADLVTSVHRMNKTSQLNNVYVKNADEVLLNIWGFHGAPPMIVSNLFDVYVENGALSIFQMDQELLENLPVIQQDSDPYLVNLEYANIMAKRDAKNMMYNLIKKIGYVIDENTATDINYPEDLIVAEALLKNREEKNHAGK
jgi:CMP-N,N'-diacetyllegionaminic acid synthase